jgi:branched-chain amino acid transport system substrate-binding protein
VPGSISRREVLRQVGLLGAAALVAACSTPAPSAPAGTAAASSGGSQPYTIGVTYPLTGPLAAFGTQVLPSIEIAADDVNKAGGIKGRPVKLVVEDTRSTPEGGVAAMRKVVDVDKVPVIITIFTNVVTAQIPLAEQSKVPLISPVEAPGVVSGTQWAFAYAPTFDHDLPLLVEHWKKVGIKRLFAFFPDNAIANFYSPTAKDAAQQVGATYDEARYKFGETDYRGIVARARDFDPDSILINGQGTPDDGVLIKQLREIGVNAPLYNGSNNFSTESWRSAVGPYAEGMVFAGFVIDQDKAKPFLDAYKARVNIDASQVCVEAYDQTRMVAQTIEQKGYSGEAIRDGLASLKGFTSVNGGTVEMGDDHQARPAVGLYKIQNNAIVKIQPGG